MKLWGMLRKNDRIRHQASAEYEGLKVEDVQDWNELLGSICRELDISRPIILPKHLSEIHNFSRVVFRPDDFIESVDFDKFEVEIYTKTEK